MSTPSPSNLPNEQATPRTNNELRLFAEQKTEPAAQINYLTKLALRLETELGWEKNLHGQTAVVVEDLNQMLNAAQAQIAKLTESLAKEEAACTEEIKNRDDREEVINDLCAAVGHVCGFQFEWSSHYGFADAVEDVEAIWQAKCDEADALRAQVADLTRSLEVKQGLVEWRTGIPVVENGKCQTFWCAFENSKGKISHRSLQYANAYIMPLAEEHDDPPINAVPVGADGDYEWTGWFETSCDQCETQWSFTDRVVAWLNLPRFTGTTQPAQSTAQGTDHPDILCVTCGVGYHLPSGVCDHCNTLAPHPEDRPTAPPPKSKEGRL